MPRKAEARVGPPREYPVLRKFFTSRGDVDVIIGPLGCTPRETEFLSRTGWRAIGDFSGEEIAAWDPDTGKIAWCVPEYVSGPATEMIEFKTGGVSMRLSANHRLPLYDYLGRFCVRTAEEVEAHPGVHRVPIHFDPGIPDLPIRDAALRLRVAINADGHHPKRGFQTIITVRKERKKERLRWLFAENLLAYAERTYPSRPTETLFTFRWPEYRPRKRFDGDWWQLSQRQLAIVLDELSHWDGLYTTDETRFFTVYKQDADFIQYAAHATGGKATIRRKEGRPNEQPLFTVYVAREGSRKATATLRRDTTKVERIPAEEQFCFRTPTSFWIARDRDCIFITGNSGKTFGVLQRILAMACEQKPNGKGVRKTRGGVLRNTWPELETATLPDIERFFLPLGARITRGIPPSMRLETQLPDKTTVSLELVFVAGLDQPDSEEKLRGHQWTWVWANEGRQIPLAVWGMAIARTGRFPSQEIDGANPTWRGGLMDTNAFDVDHALHKLLDHPPAGWNFFIQPPGVFRGPGDTWVPNPEAENLTNLDPDYYARIAKGRPEDWVRVNLANEFIFHTEGRAVYPQYQDSVHCPGVLLATPNVPLRLGFDFGRCYDDQTDVLTENGWKRFAEVDASERVATLNPKTHRLEYVVPSQKVVFDFDGELIHFSGVNLDFRVTAEHRVPFTHRETPDVIHFATAADLATRLTAHRYVTVATRGGWVGEVPERLPAGMSASVFARFMGWWLSEGSVERGTNRIAITQKKPSQELERLMFETGLDWKKRSDGYRTSHRELRAYLGACGLQTNRTVPREVMNLPVEHLVEFVDAYTLGDGHRRFRNGKSEEHVVFSTSRSMVDSMQEIAVRVGWGSGLRWQKAQSSTLRDGRVVVGNGLWVVSFKKRAERAELLPHHVSKEHYSGKIFCLTVPYHTLCIRRRGKVSWNGNTPAMTISQHFPEYARWVGIAELTTLDQPAAEFAPRAKAFLDANFPGYPMVGYGDPAGDRDGQTVNVTPTQLLQAAGIACQPAYTNDPILRRAALSRPMTRLGMDGKPAFQISSQMKVIRKGLQGAWVYARLGVRGREEYRDIPEKSEWSHPIEALEYSAVDIEGRGAVRPHYPGADRDRMEWPTFAESDW